MSELSPAAQAVLDAFLNGYIAAPKSGVAFCDDRKALAAALRAAADQMASHHSKTFLYSISDYLKLHTIAAELENHQ